jgi:hypothetical protein
VGAEALAGGPTRGCAAGGDGVLMDTRYTGIRFESAVRMLRSKQQPQMDDAVRVLRQAKITTTSARIVAEYAPHKLEDVEPVNLLDWPRQIGHGWHMCPIDEIAMGVLADIFPCHTDGMEECLLNFVGEGVPFGIMIYPFIKDYSEESFDEAADRPDGYFCNGELAKLAMLAAYLDHGVNDQCFYIGNEYFEWGLEILPVTSYDWRKSDNFDRKKFYRRLDKLGLENFKLIFEAEFSNTGNPFLDWTMDDVYDDQPIEYSLESVQEIEENWRDAQDEIEKIRACAIRANEEKWIYEAIVDAWNRACADKGKRPRRARTLVEVFNDD